MEKSNHKKGKTIKHDVQPAIPAGNFSRRDKLKTFRKDFTLLSDASRRYEPKFATNLAGMADVQP